MCVIRGLACVRSVATDTVDRRFRVFMRRQYKHQVKNDDDKSNLHNDDAPAVFGEKQFDSNEIFVKILGWVGITVKK